MVMPSVRSTRQRSTSGALATPRASVLAPGGISPGTVYQRPGVSMEGAVLYRKAIDNSGVRYKHDPRDRNLLARNISWGLFAVFMLLVLSGPRLWVRQWGYRQEQLAQRIERLAAVRDQLKVHRGRMEDLSRIAALAELDGLAETDPERYKWAGEAPPANVGATDTTVARLFPSQGR
ncbi:MAG: hypothetical protein OXN89_24595 [Bryobacterales bacterium]|nr:hypothetical protein [Bryobacterales bacterium]